MLGFLRCVSLLNFEQLKNKKESRIDIELLVRSLVDKAERMSLGMSLNFSPHTPSPVASLNSGLRNLLGQDPRRQTLRWRFVCGW